MKHLPLAIIALVAASAQAQPPAGTPAHEMTREEVDQYVSEQGLIGTRIYTGPQPIAVDVLVADSDIADKDAGTTPLPPPCEPPVPYTGHDSATTPQPPAPDPCPVPRR